MNLDPDLGDIFASSNLRIHKRDGDAFQDSQSNDGKKPRPRTPERKLARFQMKFYKWPVTLFEALIEQKAGWAVWTVAGILLEKHFKDINHSNPVRLTSADLQRFGISRYHKYQSLIILAKTNLFRIERCEKKNPSVLLCWEPDTRDEHTR
jgi:hypothetical protein